MGKQYNKYYNKNYHSSKHHDNLNMKEQDINIKEDVVVITQNESNIEQDTIEDGKQVIMEDESDIIKTKKRIDVVYQRDVKYVVTVDALNVREHSSFDSNVKRILHKGTIVSVDHYDNEDALIQTSDGYKIQNEKWIKIFRPCCGYVRSDFITGYLNESSIQL